MPVATRSQRLARAAHAQIAIHIGSHNGQPDKEFTSRAKKFPALIHTCGLAQAVAFGMAKKETEYLGYLAAVLRAVGYDNLEDAQALDRRAREAEMSDYMRLSRDAIEAASWLKRYVEAAAGDDD